MTTDPMNPNPIDPGPGCRLLTIGERVRVCDEYLHEERGWETVAYARYLVSAGNRPHRRRITPQSACEGRSLAERILAIPCDPSCESEKGGTPQANFSYAFRSGFRAGRDRAAELAAASEQPDKSAKAFPEEVTLPACCKCGASITHLNHCIGCGREQPAPEPQTAGDAEDLRFLLKEIYNVACLDMNAGAGLMARALGLVRDTADEALKLLAPASQPAGDAAERAAERIVQRWDDLNKNGNGHGSTRAGLAEIIRAEFAPMQAKLREQEQFIAALTASLKEQAAHAGIFRRAVGNAGGPNDLPPDAGVVYAWADAQAVHTKEMQARVAELEAALQVCSATFARYAELHFAKNTPEGDEKGQANWALAEECNQILTHPATQEAQ